MKNRNFFILFLIIIVAILFRFWSIDKPEGLWNDEYVSWFIASRDSFSDFISRVSKNCHTPLYYIFLRTWLLFFPDTDISLRISSVVMSILTVITMFFIGKEYKDTKSGLLCALFASLSSFYIYFAQEVRIYSLLSFITSSMILSTIKLLKEGRVKYFCIFIILNAMLCAVHTLGLIFSFFLILYTIIYLYKNFDNWKEIIKNCRNIIRYIFPFICVIILISPFVFSILFAKTLSQFWSGFSFSKIAFSFIDYFSPIQCNIINSPDTFRTYFFKDGQINYMFIIFGLTPTFMACYLIMKGFFQKEKILNLLLYACLSFFAVILSFSAIGKIVLLTKYTSEMYPVLILAFSTGVFSLKNKHLQKIFLISYFLISLIFLYFSPISAPKMGRPEGNNAPIILIKQSRLKYGDFIVFTYYDIDKFERYFKDTNKYKIFSISKFNFNSAVFNNSNYIETIKDGQMLYRTKFKEFPNQNVINYANKYIIKEMKKGDKVGLVFLKGVSFLPNSKLKEISEDDVKYKKTSFIFMTFSLLRNSLMEAFKDDFKMDSITQIGDWTLVVYEKIR